MIAKYVSIFCWLFNSFVLFYTKLPLFLFMTIFRFLKSVLFVWLYLHQQLQNSWKVWKYRVIFYSTFGVVISKPMYPSRRSLPREENNMFVFGFSVPNHTPQKMVFSTLNLSTNGKYRDCTDKGAFPLCRSIVVEQKWVTTWHVRYGASIFYWRFHHICHISCRLCVSFSFYMIVLVHKNVCPWTICWRTV